MDAPSQTPLEAKLNSGCPLGRQLDRYQRDEMLLMTGAVVPQRASDLLLNCDLPPPLKFFPASPKGIGAGSAGTALRSPPPKQIFLWKADHHGVDVAELDRSGDAQDNLLKALRLSQTRAREAEKKVAALGEKNKQISSLLMESSLRLYAHRQWLKLLEMENAWLHKENGMRRTECPGRAGVRCTPGGCVVVAICLGMAGLGFVIGYRFML